MLLLANKEPKVALGALVREIQALGAFLDESDVLFVVCGFVLAVGFTFAGSFESLLLRYDLFFVLQELPSIVPGSSSLGASHALEGRSTVRGVPGGRGASRALLLRHRLLLVAALLLFDVNPSLLIVVLQERANCVIFHIALPAYLERLEVVRKVVVDDVDSSLQIDELVVCMRLPIDYWLPFLDGGGGLCLSGGRSGGFYACYRFLLLTCWFICLLCH